MNCVLESYLTVLLTCLSDLGLNSSKGIPKLKNAVLEWLKNKNIQYDLLNDGCVKIVW